MKRSRLVLGLVLALAALRAARADQTTAEKQAEAAHEELRGLMKEMVAAYNAGDVDKLLATLDDNCVITWQNAQVNKGSKQVKAYIEEMTRGPNRVVEKSTIAPEPDDPSFLYNDNHTAVAFGHSKDHYKLTDGTQFDHDTRWTATLVKKDGKWKATSIHISTNMFDNPILNMAVKRSMLWFGGIGAGAGLLLGLLAGLFLRRSGRRA
jgi:uncharacterized protein (TIGR02246 family)